nr:uncharacterized protein LOC106829160 [Equus asinus]
MRRGGAAARGAGRRGGPAEPYGASLEGAGPGGGRARPRSSRRPAGGEGAARSFPPALLFSPQPLRNTPASGRRAEAPRAKGNCKAHLQPAWQHNFIGLKNQRWIIS